MGCKKRCRCAAIYNWVDACAIRRKDGPLSGGPQ